ncbi:HEPN domain-containing protein [Botryobacter ruber]|uniref:HEPN domain-containing protein n=1 Tax=Botryobacter ruber TaxID=2171629 RepID=UPI000E0C4E90|nr:HEPN domain-containing protein [Botryobacter ruber]
MKDKATILFDDALDKLNRAKEESFRPKKDLVTYLVCKNAQASIENFLKGYLLQNEFDPSRYTTLDELLQKCKSINKSFEQVDLAAFNCKGENLNAAFCNDTPNACKCLDVSAKLETFLRQEKIIG